LRQVAPVWTVSRRSRARAGSYSAIRSRAAAIAARTAVLARSRDEARRRGVGRARCRADLVEQCFACAAQSVHPFLVGPGVGLVELGIDLAQSGAVGRYRLRVGDLTGVGFGDGGARVARCGGRRLEHAESATTGSAGRMRCAVPASPAVTPVTLRSRARRHARNAASRLIV